MPHWNNQPWQRNSSKIASGKPGAVHCARQRRQVQVSSNDHSENTDYKRTGGVARQP